MTAAAAAASGGQQLQCSVQARAGAVSIHVLWLLGLHLAHVRQTRQALGQVPVSMWCCGNACTGHNK